MIMLQNDDAAECFIRNAQKELKDQVFFVHTAGNLMLRLACKGQ